MYPLHWLLLGALEDMSFGVRDWRSLISSCQKWYFSSCPRVAGLDLEVVVHGYCRAFNADPQEKEALEAAGRWVSDNLQRGESSGKT